MCQLCVNWFHKAKLDSGKARPHSKRCKLYFPIAFPKRQLPKGIFPNSNFTTVQLPKSVLAATLCLQAHPSRSDPHCSLQRLRRSNLTFVKLLLGKSHIWEVATWEIVIQRSRSWENVQGKILNTIKKWFLKTKNNEKIFTWVGRLRVILLKDEYFTGEL